MKRLLILLCFISFWACNKCEEVVCIEPGALEDVLIVGLTFGECLGDCAHFLKIEGGQVFLDKEEGYFNNDNTLQFSEESFQATNIVEGMIELSQNFPQFLLNTTETRFGCPDCGDWGAMPVIKLVNGEWKLWILDNQIESNPEDVQEWARQIQKLVSEVHFN